MVDSLFSVHSFEVKVGGIPQRSSSRRSAGLELGRLSWRVIHTVMERTHVSGNSKRERPTVSTEDLCNSTHCCMDHQSHST